VDERLRSSLIRKGYQQVQRFSWERTAEQVHATYHDVVQAQRSPR